MTKILTKGPPITWKCQIPRNLVLLCLFVLWFSLAKTEPDTVPILNLGPLYDSSQPRHLGILVPFTEELFSQYVTTKSHRYDIPWESPSIFSRRYHLPILLL